ncbi:hypothetical protein M5E06_21060 [Azospirillum sp. A1-3]|uniref:hypothetical protein n=1 Tax=Azospirillum sp. A1-3 TaxID=185874 RepID=UPI0020773242|nr:hypothetical protein [Azospirillum sp. A1-3]MCM8736620.1 hypothetical protein [Azospirillum sp. A1-3]
MSDQPQTDIIAAFNRVLDARKALLKSKNNWRVLSGLPKTTALDAFAGKNPTMDTLQKLATAAEMTVAEMLEYGDPDWETKAQARAILRQMQPGEITSLTTLLKLRIDRAEGGNDERAATSE